MGYGVVMRERGDTHLMAEDRDTVSLGLTPFTLQTMAWILGRAPSTVSHEYARNTTRDCPYRTCTAHTQAATQSRQSRWARTLMESWRWPYVQPYLVQGCSPEHIAGRFQRAYLDDMRAHLSAETSRLGSQCCPAAR